jgi:hypothetical protein
VGIDVPEFDDRLRDKIEFSSSRRIIPQKRLSGPSMSYEPVVSDSKSIGVTDGHERDANDGAFIALHVVKASGNCPGVE